MVGLPGCRLPGLVEGRALVVVLKRENQGTTEGPTGFEAGESEVKGGREGFEAGWQGSRQVLNQAACRELP